MLNRNRQVAFILDRFWTVEDCRSNPHCLFVFGDNLARRGKKGQAVIRDEPNSIGIPTKKRPKLRKEDFFTDDEYDQNVVKRRKQQIVNLMRSGAYEWLVLPSAGWGTGLTQLDKKAPRTYEYCKLIFDELTRLTV